MSEEMTPYEEGAKAAASLTGSAADCPYMPNTHKAERSRWLAGFSEARPATSPASDPARADEPRPDRSSGKSTPGYKQG